MAESDAPDQHTPEPTAAPASEPPRRGRPVWPWLVLLAAALLGIVVGTTLGMRTTSLFPGPAAQAVARPTIVIGTSPSPSPVAVSGSPSPASSPAAGPAATEDYVVEPGDTMRSIAQQVYGDPELWPRIYEANRDLIGPNPDALQVGMHLKIPRT